MLNRKKVLILGQEGYIGTALTLHLRTKAEYILRGIDNQLRENNVRSVGSDSLTPKTRVGAMNVSTNSSELKKLIQEFQPDAIVHLAEQPSAAFSMKSAEKACVTQYNNVVGTLRLLWAIKEACPTAHLIKLGTEGEYPDWLWDGKEIPEGSRMNVLVPKNGRVGAEPGYAGEMLDVWNVPTPRYAGSWYHFSKLHDSMNIDYACRIWGLKATDVNQGIVYGHIDGTRLDYDECFGTVVNRFAVQAALGVPLTVYGSGGQTRGFIALQNSIDAIKLLIDNPPKQGEFRVIHQTTESRSVLEIAEMVRAQTGAMIEHLENPRAEMSENHFTFDTSTLDGLGLKPVDMERVVADLCKTARLYKGKIKRDVIKPKTTWK